jgi:hypothetical protein
MIAVGGVRNAPENAVSPCKGAGCKGFLRAFTANLPHVDGYARDGTAVNTNERVMETDFDF